MPSLINRVPPGLLSLLDIKALGVNPSILPDELSANLDVTSLYFAATAQILSAITTTITVPGVSTITQLTVPAGELWVVNRCALSADAVLGAGTTYRLRPIVYHLPTQRIVQAGELVTVTANERPVASFPNVLVMTAGEQLAIHADAAVLGIAQSFRMSAQVTRLLI